MVISDGLFASALDAEVDHREGLNYLWMRQEVEGLLSPEDAAIALPHFGLNKGPNFRDPHHPSDPAANVLFLAADAPPIDDSTRHRIYTTLLTARDRRKQPHRDDKVITSWNALMIAALADCGRMLNDSTLILSAQRSLDALLATHVRPDGEVFRISRPAAGAPAGTPGMLEDFAALALACQAVHAASPVSSQHSDIAKRILRSAQQKFADPIFGVCDTRGGQSDVFLRGRALHDGAVPSATSMLLHALRRTASTEDWATQWLIQIMGTVSASLAESPVNHINSVRCLMHILTGDQPEVVAALATLGPTRHSGQESDAPVQVFSSTDRVSLSDSEPAVFDLVLRVQQGFHIIAADPGPGGQSLFPLRLEVVGGTGVVVYADYPAGVPLNSDATVLVHQGQIEFRVVLERTGEWSGRPLLIVTYQACTETECRRAVTVEIDVAIDRVG
jgi:uncharacterized protein YyaL (SSP411 family)